MSLRAALLALIEVRGPSSGYDLTKSFEGSLAHVWQASHSQIYPELNRMAADGLLKVEEEGPRGRKTYAITAAGQAELHEWLTEAKPEQRVRDEASLRAFLLPLLPTQKAIELLTEQARAAEARKVDLEALRRKVGESSFGGFALERGLRHMAAEREWALWAIDRLQKSEEARTETVRTPTGEPE
ncbi:PadR family transcriptional regulator [Actinoallomurus sp. NPDC050550]|uniref:PadR family transcriptional regulator n=1 Tax=Actinoallomurus sp. NPDC050550 TaxID=3154937 RepID=UPI0034061D39